MYFFFSYKWKQYIISTINYTLSVVATVVIIVCRVKKFKHRARNLYRSFITSYHESRQVTGTDSTIEIGRLAQSSPSNNESLQKGLPPTALPQSSPLQDNNGYATDDIYEEFDERRQSSGSAFVRTFSVTNETQLRRMSSDSVDTMVSQTGN